MLGAFCAMRGCCPNGCGGMNTKFVMVDMLPNFNRKNVWMGEGVGDCVYRGGVGWVYSSLVRLLYG